MIIINFMQRVTYLCKFSFIGDVWVSVEDAVGSSSADLIIPQASASDAGTYRCVAKSEAGAFLAEVAAVVEREFYFFLLKPVDR